MIQDPGRTLNGPPSLEFSLDEPRSRLRRIPDQLLARLLSILKIGHLTIHTPGGRRIVHDATPEPEATIVLHNWRAIRRLITRGGIGFAQAYMEGEWSSPDVTGLMILAGRNVEALEPVLEGTSRKRFLDKFRHRRSANTRRGSRRNIAAHYDLGNEFYAQWLDPGMSYSSALFTDPDATLEAAQEAKQDRAIALLGLAGGERVLEIGCGWGGLMEKLLGRGAGQVTGLTLSTEQRDYARRRLDAAGLAARSEVRLQDYREVAGAFDRIVSIEMLEAVGQEYWPVYFDGLRDHLAEGGSAVLQVITIAKERFEDYRRSVDFIQRYIFPGGMLPTREVIGAEIERAGLRLRSVEHFGQSYALTLAEWRRRFHLSWPAIESLGFDTRFRRMWDYYLCYCEAGFRTGILDVGLYAIDRPLAEAS